MMLFRVFLSLASLPVPILGQQTTSAQNSTNFALVYGYPLLAFQKLADRFLQYNVSNLIYHARDLSTAENRTVVRPNVDTLYSAILYDVSQVDIALQVPEIPPDEFVLFSFYDPYGDNYANFGTSLFQHNGSYLLQRPSNASLKTGFIPRDETTMSSEFVADVYSPTTYGIVLIRWLVNSTNLDDIHRLQDQTTISLNNRSTASDVPALTTLDTTAIVDKDKPAQQVLNLLAAYGGWNLPQASNASIQVARALQNAGISGDMYMAPEGIDLEAANSSALAMISAAATNASNIFELNNGWSITPPGLAGNFDNGTNFAYRAAVAASGYLMLQAPVAIYPSWTNHSNPSQTSDDGSFVLDPNEAWLYTFSRKPPLQKAGFWSMTVYADNYLIPNDLGRYEAGDRSNLTYPDGTTVYGLNSSDNDGLFQVLVQAADNPPPANWTNNWIPGPAGGGSIGVWLRFYLAQEDLLDGTYNYPVVERRAAITGIGSGTSVNSSTSTSGPSGSSPSSAPSSTTLKSSACRFRVLDFDHNFPWLVAAYGATWIGMGV